MNLLRTCCFRLHDQRCKMSTNLNDKEINKQSAGHFHFAKDNLLDRAHINVNTELVSMHFKRQEGLIFEQNILLKLPKLHYRLASLDKQTNFRIKDKVRIQ